MTASPGRERLEKYRFCSHMLDMLAPTPRRTDAVRLRQTISQLLDHLYAIEHSMEVFRRKGDQGELGRASENFNEMLGHVDRLGEIITEARGRQRAAQHDVGEPAE